IMAKFQDAVEHVLNTGHPAYTAIIEKRNGEPSAAQIYVIWRDEDNVADPDENGAYRVDYTAGDFDAGGGEEGFYGPDDVPDEAKRLPYELITFDCDVLETMSYDVNVVLEVFKGRALEDVLEDLD